MKNWKGKKSEETIRINSRRPYDDDNPDGYLESDKDFVLNNIDACLQFLESNNDLEERRKQ